MGLLLIKTKWNEDAPMTGIGEDNHVPYSQLVGKQNSINPTEH